MKSFQIYRNHSDDCGADGSERQSNCDCLTAPNIKHTDQEKIEELVDCVLTCCGQIGFLTKGELEGESFSECEKIAYKIQTGLAHAVVDTLEKTRSTNVPDLIHWFGFCLINMGYDTDDRITALLDALRNELLSREKNLTDEETGTCEVD